MSLTVKDFVEMIRTSRAAAGFSHNDGVVRRIWDVYGHTMESYVYRHPAALLTQYGIDEYNHVKAWITGGCDGELIPVHSVERLGAHANAHRKYPLFTSAPRASGTIMADERKSLRATARAHAQPYTAPQEQFKKIQQTNVVMFLRSMLLQISNDPKTPQSTQCYIAEGLLACQAELQIMVNI